MPKNNQENKSLDYNTYNTIAKIYSKIEKISDAQTESAKKLYVEPQLENTADILSENSSTGIKIYKNFDHLISQSGPGPDNSLNIVGF